MDRRKELREQYKNRKVVGGVYRIINRENGRFYLRSTGDIQAARNVFARWRTFDDCSLPPVQADWKAFGKEAFALEELDLLEKGELQTQEAFAEDIRTLLKMWDEKLPREGRY